MFRVVVIAALLQAPLFDPRFQRFESRNTPGRTDRGFMDDAPFFEAFGTNGAGMTGVCNTTAPTGAKGEALTFTRATAATCTKGGAGLRATGIANGDLVAMGSGVVRQMFDDNGVLGLLVEEAATNLLLRYIEYANAAWADVGTPTLTGSQTDPFGATAAVQIDDNDAGAFEGRSQSVTVSAGAAHTMHCYVKAGTLDQARISLDGTTADITGLSATTWSIVSVTDASSSGVSISAQVLVGDAVGDTGTVIFGGCQVETGSYFTSIIPTTSAAVTRNAESLTVNGSGFPTDSYSVSASIIMQGAGSGTRGIVEGQVGSNSGVGFFTVAGFLRTQNLTAGADNTTNYTWGSAALTQYRVVTFNDGSNQTMLIDGATVAGPSAATHPDAPWSATTGLGYAPAFPSRLNGIISRICVDPSASRCR